MSRGIYYNLLYQEGKLSDIYDAVAEVGASILLAASVVHYRLLSIRQVKGYLRNRGVVVSLGELKIRSPDSILTPVCPGCKVSNQADRFAGVVLCAERSGCNQCEQQQSERGIAEVRDSRWIESVGEAAIM